MGFTQEYVCTAIDEGFPKCISLSLPCILQLSHFCNISKTFYVLEVFCNISEVLQNSALLTLLLLMHYYAFCVRVIWGNSIRMPINLISELCAQKE